MFDDVDAEALVVAVEKTKFDGKMWSEASPVGTFQFVLEVQPADGKPYRVMVETKLKDYDFRTPGVGETVPVVYHARHPDKVELKLSRTVFDKRHGPPEDKHAVQAAKEAA